jgi:hypothetical protein
MVQYYRDLWAKRSEILAPLTALVGGYYVVALKIQNPRKNGLPVNLGTGIRSISKLLMT